MLHYPQAPKSLLPVTSIVCIRRCADLSLTTITRSDRHSLPPPTASRRKIMARVNGVKAVENFWAEVWAAPQNPEAIDRLVVEDFVITSGGADIVSRAKFKEWVKGFQAKITDLQFEVFETFQNDDGSRVASRWAITGKNNGILGTARDQRPIRFTGTAIWAVREDGMLLHNWVERAAWELYVDLTQK